MNYVVMSEVETTKELEDMTFASEIVYLFDPPLETEAEEAGELSRLVEDRVIHGLFLDVEEPLAVQ